MKILISAFRFLLLVSLSIAVSIAQLSHDESVSTSKALTVSPLISSPLPINLDEVQFAIQYPEDAQEEGVEGTVACKVLVDAQGEYVQHRIVSAPDSRLRDAVDLHMPRLRFVPASKNGHSVPVWTTVKFVFALTDGHTTPKKTRAMQVKIWEESAQAQVEAKHFQKAMELYEKAIAISEGEQKEYLLISAIEAAIMAKEYAQARVYLTHALYLVESPKQQADILMIKALSAMLGENHGQAVYYLERSQLIAPGYFSDIDALQPYINLDSDQIRAAVSSLRSLESNPVGMYLAIRLEEL